MGETAVGDSLMAVGPAAARPTGRRSWRTELVRLVYNQTSAVGAVARLVVD
jgi:hypothetical protein